MTQDDVSTSMVLVCSTNAGVGYLDEDFVRTNFSSRGRLHYISVLGTFEDSEGWHDELSFGP